MVTRFFSVNSEDLISKIKKENYKVVSFDIFDTLVKRNVNDSRDIFLLLEQEYVSFFKKEKPISKMREDAEAKVDIDSADLNIIYDTINELDDEEKAWLKEKEISLELQLCQQNKQLKRVFNWCKNNGKKILIISDMYLRKDVIEKILIASGYSNWDSLYISCEYKARKATGNLFDIVKEKEQLEVNEWLHIGDAQIGDFLAPKKKGINAFLIKINEWNTDYYSRNYLIKEREMKRYEYNILNSFIKNNESRSYNYYERLGYEVVGPILYGYSKWLQSKSEELGVKKLFFLAREGAFLKEAFEIVSDSSVDSTLIKVSRKATSTPLLYKAESMNELLRMINKTRKNFTVKDLLDSCNIEDIDRKAILNNVELSAESNIDELTDEQIGDLFTASRYAINNNSKKQEEYIRGYLSNLGFNGSVGVCDVGWNGTIQNNLQRIFANTSIIGFYIGKKNKIKDTIKSKSEAFLFDDTKNLDIKNNIMSSPDIFELFFLSTDGTTIKYERREENFYSVQALPDQSLDNAKEIIKLQSAALKFVSDFKAFTNNFNTDLTPECCGVAYNKFINPPSLYTVKMFKRFSFLNVGTHSMVAEHSLFYYIFNPKGFVEEFLNNGSKSLFLRSVFKISLPYVDIIDFLRKFDRGWLVNEDSSSFSYI